MSAYQYEEFERRMRRINRRHTRLSQGYRTEITGDNLVIAKPRGKKRTGTLRGLALIFMTMLLFKGFLHAQLGPAAYADRVERLGNGTIVEQAGAWAMTADPVTLWLSSKFSSLVR